MAPRGGVTDHNAAMNNKAERTWRHIEGTASAKLSKSNGNGAPEAMGYCHCNACRTWSAAPVNAFTLWKPENVTVTTADGLVGHFMKTSMSDRQYCTMRRSSHDQASAAGHGGRYAATIPSVAFTPAVHVNYAETVLPIGDGCQAQGLPGRNGRLGNCPARISSRRSRRPAMSGRTVSPRL